MALSCYEGLSDMESLLEKIDACQSNPKISSKTKINKHTTSGYSLFIHCLFDATENNYDYYRGEDCTKKFSRDLKKHATKIWKKKKENK